MCYTRDYKNLEDKKKKAEGTNVAQERRAGLIKTDRLAVQIPVGDDRATEIRLQGSGALRLNSAAADVSR